MAGGLVEPDGRAIETLKGVSSIHVVNPRRPSAALSETRMESHAAIVVNKADCRACQKRASDHAALPKRYSTFLVDRNSTSCPLADVLFRSPLQISLGQEKEKPGSGSGIAPTPTATVTATHNLSLPLSMFTPVPTAATRRGC